MKKPIFRVLTALDIIFIFAWIWCWAKSGEPAFVILLFIGAVVGPYMGLSFPFELAFKIGYSIALFLSISGFIAGIKFMDRIWAQTLIVISVVGWFFCGFIGLGTGT